MAPLEKFHFRGRIASSEVLSIMGPECGQKKMKGADSQFIHASSPFRSDAAHLIVHILSNHAGKPALIGCGAGTERASANRDFHRSLPLCAPPHVHGRLSLFLGTALLLGSCYGVLCTPVFIGLFAVRAVLEERLLRKELEGYDAYVARVKYRFFPHVW
jgi:hypothetical protein